MASLTVNGFREGESVGVAVTLSTQAVPEFTTQKERRKKRKRMKERKSEKVREGIFYKLFIIYHFPHSLPSLNQNMRFNIKKCT